MERASRTLRPAYYSEAPTLVICDQAETMPAHAPPARWCLSHTSHVARRPCIFPDARLTASPRALYTTATGTRGLLPIVRTGDCVCCSSVVQCERGAWRKWDYGSVNPWGCGS